MTDLEQLGGLSFVLGGVLRRLFLYSRMRVLCVCDRNSDDMIALKVPVCGVSALHTLQYC